MKNYINIKLYLLFAGLFLIFNLSCEDDDYPEDTTEVYTYTLSLEKSVLNADEDGKNYADGPTSDTRDDEQIITATLLEIDSNDSPTAKSNISIEFFITTDGNSQGAGFEGLEDNKATTNANGQVSITWNDDPSYIGTVDVDSEYKIGTELVAAPELPISFNVYSVYEKVYSINASNLTIDLPLSGNNNSTDYQVRVLEEDGLNGVDGIEVGLYFDSEEHPYLSVTDDGTDNDIFSITNNGGYATFQVILDENHESLSANLNDSDVPNTLEINMYAVIESEFLQCDGDANENCDTIDIDNDGTPETILGGSFNTIVNQSGTQTEDSYSTIDGITATTESDPFILDPNDEELTLSINAFVYAGNEAVPGISVLFESDNENIIIPSNNIIVTDENGMATLAITNFATLNENTVEDVDFLITIIDENGVIYTNDAGTPGEEDDVVFITNLGVSIGSQLAFNIDLVEIVSLNVAGSSNLILSDGSSSNSDEDTDNEDDGEDNGDADDEDTEGSVDEDNNSFALTVSVKNELGVGISGIPVLFQMSDGGLGQISGEVITDDTGLATNSIENISSSNPNIIESFDVTAYVEDPTTNELITFDSITLQVGNQFAYNFPQLDLVQLNITPNPFPINDIPQNSDSNADSGNDSGSDDDNDNSTDDTNNPLSITATVRDEDGGPLSGVPVHFTNETVYGTFSNNDVASAEDGTVTIELQNINIPQTPGIQNITIKAAVIDPSTDTEAQYDEQQVEVAYQSVLNINEIFSLSTARVQAITSDNNINIQYSDTIKSWVNNENGNGVQDVPIQFSLLPDGENNIIGLLDNDEVWTDSDGYAYSIFTLTDADLLNYTNQTISANVEVAVEEFSGSESWTYFIEGSPNIELDVDAFNYYSTDLPNSTHNVSILSGDTLNLPFIAKDQDGIRIEGVAVRYEVFGSSVPNRSYGDLTRSLAYTCCIDSLTAVEDWQDWDGDLNPERDENMGIANSQYTNIIDETVTIDSIRGYITNPITNELLFYDEVYVHVSPPYSQVSGLFSYPIPQTILMNIMDSVYCDTITTIASDTQGQSLRGVNIEFSLDSEDQTYGYISQYATVTDSIPGQGFYGARTTFCTYPNITIENERDTINIAIQAPDTNPILTDAVEIYLEEDLPDCPDCVASLTLISEHYILPAGDNDIYTSLITATVIDSTENTVPENTLVQFQSLTEDEDGDLVPIGSIQPNQFTNSEGIATATFNIEASAGLAQIIATAPTFNLADTLYIDIQSSVASALELVNPFPNEIMVQGGGGIESSELTMLVKDGSGNLVTEPFLVHYRILNSAPVGVYLNVPGNGFVACAQSSNGEATVTLNSGSQPGSVPIRAELYPLDIAIDCGDISGETFDAYGIASLEAVPVTVVTGPPEFGQINYSYVDIAPIGGGLYQLPIAVNLWDFYSNPVADSTNVYVWIEGIAPAWNSETTYTRGDTIKWGDVDNADPPNVIEVDSLLYVWNYDDPSTSLPIDNPIPGDGYSLFGEVLWLPMQHPGSIVGESKTGMENNNGETFPGVAWSNVYYGTSNMFDNSVIKALTYNSDGEKLILDARDSHNGEGLVLPFMPGDLLLNASIQLYNFSVGGIPGLNNLEDTVAITLQGNLTDYYQYPVSNGRISLSAPQATIWTVCDPADTDNDGFIGCCDSFDIEDNNNVNGTGDGDGVCDIESEFKTCTECVANAGTWVPDMTTNAIPGGGLINGPNDVNDDPAFGKTNGNGQLVYLISYSELLNFGDGEDPETYESPITSQCILNLLDPLQTPSNQLDIQLQKTEQNDNP